MTSHNRRIQIDLYYVNAIYGGSMGDCKIGVVVVPKIDCLLRLFFWGS